MSKRRTLGVLFLLLTFAVPDLLACGDKFLGTGRFTRFQRPKDARAGSVLIYVEPKSAFATAIRKDDVEKVLKFAGHHVKTVQSLQNLSTIVSNGHHDLILTANGDATKVKSLLPASPDAATVLPIEDLVKNRTVLETVDKELLQRDQDQKKRDQDQKKTVK
jgi:hypothetical protein